MQTLSKPSDADEQRTPRPCYRRCLRVLTWAASALAIPGVVSADDQMIVFLADPNDASAIAKRYGLEAVAQGRVAPAAVAYRVPSANSLATTLAAMAKDERVLNAAASATDEMLPLHLPANDDLFYPDPALTPSLPLNRLVGQWHLHNRFGFPSVRADIAWGEGAYGKGVVIGIVDTGVDHEHLDLRGQYSARASYDFVELDFDGDPEQRPPFEGFRTVAHGTMVAGVAASGENGFGTVGVAPEATLASLRVPLAGTFSSQVPIGNWQLRMIEAIMYDRTLQVRLPDNRLLSSRPFSVCDPTFEQSPANWIKNHSYAPNKRFTSAQAIAHALELSSACGVIHVLGAGNWRGEVAEDSNTSPLLSTPASIAVAAVGHDGRFAEYSNFGANVFVSAPSSAGRQPGVGAITTTDRRGAPGANGGDDVLDLEDPDYTSTFGGTSAASPTAAGALALLRGLRPDLDTRMAKHLLARTSRPIDGRDQSDSSDGGWRENRAGFRFNQNYGFGVIDAGALATYPKLESVRVTQLRVFASDARQVHDKPTRQCMDCSAQVVIGTGALFAPAEEVMVEIDVEHPNRGALQIELTSPNGTRTRLLRASADDGGADLRWRFLTNALWGENVVGSWTVRIFHPDSETPVAWRWKSLRVIANSGTLVGE